MILKNLKVLMIEDVYWLIFKTLREKEKKIRRELHDLLLRSKASFNVE